MQYLGELLFQEHSILLFLLGNCSLPCAWFLLSHKQLRFCCNLLIKSSRFLATWLFTVFSLCLYTSLLLLRCFTFLHYFSSYPYFFGEVFEGSLFGLDGFCHLAGLPAVLYLHKKRCTSSNPLTEDIQQYENQRRQWRNLLNAPSLMDT